MKVVESSLPGVLLIEPVVHGDDRGFFVETYAEPRYRAAGISDSFVQDNLSFSRRGTLRGLHLQHPRGQGKLCSVLEGEVFDVAVDARVGSPTFGKWTSVMLSSRTKNQIYVPPGFAHGFCVVSDVALFSYKCTEVYSVKDEIGVLWNDSDIGIEWPVNEPLLSPKDTTHPKLCAIDLARLPCYG